MPFPQHLDRVLVDYGVPADTKAALYDLYVSMGDEVLDVFADVAERAASVSLLRPEDTTGIRQRVVERYMGRSHPQWLEGRPTPSLWHPREAEGRASGAAVPLGDFPELVHAAVRDGHLPDGVLMLGRNAHYGGRVDTVSFDVVARELEDAMAIGTAVGQQHTLPGSVGATSATFDAVRGIALIWEVQPNVYKPAGERNRAIARLYRRHRNWHLVTLAAAVHWLTMQKATLFVLRGNALATTHEVNPQKPVSETIAALHDRTVEQVAAAAGASLEEVTDHDELELLDSSVMNHALRKHVLREGARGSMWRLTR